MMKFPGQAGRNAQPVATNKIAWPEYHLYGGHRFDYGQLELTRLYGITMLSSLQSLGIDYPFPRIIHEFHDFGGCETMVVSALGEEGRRLCR